MSDVFCIDMYFMGELEGVLSKRHLIFRTEKTNFILFELETVHCLHLYQFVVLTERMLRLTKLLKRAEKSVNFPPFCRIEKTKNRFLGRNFNSAVKIIKYTKNGLDFVLVSHVLMEDQFQLKRAQKRKFV